MTPGTYWSAETEARARAARKAELRARRRADRFQARADRLAADLANARKRERRLRERESELEAELVSAAAEIARLAGLLAESDRAHGAERLAAAAQEMSTVRPQGRHARKVTR